MYSLGYKDFGEKLLTFAVTATFAALCLPSQTDAAAPDPFTAYVVGVHDGDTLTVLSDRTQTKIRVANIDTPELGQPFGKAAKELAARLTFNETVTVTTTTTDRYGRTVAHITLPNGDDLGRRLLAAGLAWVYTKYNDDPELPKVETTARQQHLGLWADPDPVPPWDWRRRKKEK